MPGAMYRVLGFARVAELAYAPDLGSGGETLGGSNPPLRTVAKASEKLLQHARARLLAPAEPMVESGYVKDTFLTN